MPRINRKEADRASRPPDLSLTPCHMVSRISLPLVIMSESGAETPIGRVIYCGKEGFEAGRSFRCYNVLDVVLDRAVEGISDGLVRSLCQGKPPTYELSCGYHLRLQGGRWRNVRDLRARPSAPPPAAAPEMFSSGDYE